MIHRRLLASPSVLTLFVLSCSVLLVIYHLFQLHAAFSGHDQAWYLFAAERVLKGAKLYGPDVVDTNPPLILWFSTLPVLLSHILPLSLTASLRVIIVVMIFGSTAWCLRVLRRAPFMESTVVRSLIGFLILYVEMRLTAYDFGQREHLIVLLAIPYLLAAATGAIESLSIVERCGLGLAVGLAICLKPQYAVAFAAAELVLLISHRSLRRLISPEWITVVVSGGLYLLLVLILTPLYTRQMVPLLLDTYWAYATSSALTLLLAMKIRVLLASGLIAASFLLPRPFSVLVSTFAAFSIGSIVAYAVQRTDWPYHRYPIAVSLILALGIFLVGIAQALLQSLEGPRVTKPIAVVCLAAVLIVSVGFFARHEVASPERSEVYQFLKQQKDPGKVYIFSTAVIWIADVMDLKWNWASRFPCLWLLPSIVQNELGPAHPGLPFRRLSPERLASISARQRDEVAEDLDHFQPSVLMVERCNEGHPCQAIEGKNFDTIAWFLKSPRFGEAWSHYRRQPNALPAFDVYVRVP